MAHMTTQWIVVLRETGATDHGVRSPPCRNVQYRRILVTLAERPHPFPSRTRKLSSPAPKILRGQPFGKIGRRQDFCVNGHCCARHPDFAMRRMSASACPIPPRPVAVPRPVTTPRSVLAVAAVARSEATSFGLRDSLPTARAGLSSLV